MNNTTEYNKIIQKLDIILRNDNLNAFEKKLHIVNEIINPLYDKAFDLILEKEKLEKEVSDAGRREEAVREQAWIDWIERGDDGIDRMRMP